MPPPPPADDVYMTPQLQKRRDGLAPSLLMKITRESGDPKTSLTKSYQTSSKFLHKNVLNKEVDISGEFEIIVKSINSTLKELVKKSDPPTVSSMVFQAVGCKWILELDPSLKAGDYSIEVVCSACEEAQKYGNTYIVDSSLVSKDGSEGPSLVNLVNSDEDLKGAKDAADYVGLQVRKAVVRCEFPEFPEGCKEKTFREVYQLNARLKSGSFATVCRGTHRASGKKVAIKCVLRKDLPPSDDAAIFDEVSILSSVRHPHIIPLIDFFDEDDCYFLIMELMDGGDLFDRIGAKKSYNEMDARDLCAKMLKAVAYCHGKSIAHCDMKPKNLLLLNDQNDSYIKLADFGFAARVHEAKSLTKQCGTPFFVPPEILMKKPYDQVCDIWSCGCIIFLLLGGNLPFMGKSQKELFRKIVAGKYEFDVDEFAGVSDEARDLIAKMLVTDPDQRMTAAEALKHPWLKVDSTRLSNVSLAGTSQRLKTFNARLKLRSAIIAVDLVNSLKDLIC
mmetsp:Transcript_9900/g.14600  ORF Transcript_9900/g.14600 Transcript_9900/m.14600 type:complete len:505 (-) Transcript_9900:131-1645(-)|eukprot:CAMPEP_0194200536 /NCGR_PEP_ID=MMETSP0156-20130528/1096_1 /TAXON_ID=33649 /ORGANISM="Thalassionema nitzschioides, Strain L26-B" /LENGTH=504 /DNA_ID=CAMNT_0038925543 /DNA_START=148 /DNA_END=1662 /DNA_ORIENTATION=-